MPIGRFQPERVHPRVCGEAARRAPWRRPAWGPSPRVRGSPIHAPSGIDTMQGPSPRVRGSRDQSDLPRLRDRVHPRVCGEASDSPIRRCIHEAQGPSPRVRGSLRLGDARRADAFGVHPRVCGEALDRHGVDQRPADGSIPACAGKPDAAMRHPFRRVDRPGSIPACAGKPSPELLRVRLAPLARQGPSPRVRGSPCVRS